MLGKALLYGLVAGIIHFVFAGLYYGNPLVGPIYDAAAAQEPGVKEWASRARYLATQFLGTQIEVYVLTLAFFLLRSAFAAGVGGLVTLGLVLAAVRVYPRFWNMWIQSTYPNRLLALEVVGGTIGTLVVVGALGAMT